MLDLDTLMAAITGAEGQHSRDIGRDLPLKTAVLHKRRCSTSTAAVNVATTIGLTTKQQNTSLTVSARGGAQYKTIAAAIRHAQPGMRIEVQPGVYAERLLIDRPVEIVGLGHDVIIQTTTGSCLTMATTTATIRGVTLRGQAAIKKKQASTVDVSQGQLILEECDITSDSLECVSVHGQGASLIIQRCIVHDGKSIGIVISENAEATVEQCKLLSNTPVHIAISQNADATIRKCDFTGEQSYGVSINKKSKVTVSFAHKVRQFRILFDLTRHA